MTKPYQPFPARSSCQTRRSHRSPFACRQCPILQTSSSLLSIRCSRITSEGFSPTPESSNLMYGMYKALIGQVNSDGAANAQIASAAERTTTCPGQTMSTRRAQMSIARRHRLRRGEGRQITGGGASVHCRRPTSGPHRMRISVQIPEAIPADQYQSIAQNSFRRGLRRQWRPRQVQSAPIQTLLARFCSP